ncbi:MAG: N-acetylmuramoyl-L-alanine amidase, partial [Candidatus Obscuribacterales bacterium]|nr:N-acetylmuramoyl-L-alanine amidase [Candidatus Obscuribacterales bacterium]
SRINYSVNPPQTAPPIDTHKVPQLTLSPAASGNGYQITVAAGEKKDLNYKSFRLHNPERFVVDFENLTSIEQANINQPLGGKHLLGIRLGKPELKEGKAVGRLVLDLAKADTLVIPQDTGDTSIVSFLIGQGSESVSLAGLTAPTSTTIVLDAGHGGTDPGAQRNNLNEKDITLAIALKTYDYLVEHGAKVVLTRKDDTSVSLAERVETTNRIRPDAFLSVHINSLESTSDIHGIETYYQTPQSRALAEKIHQNLVKDLKAPDRFIRKAKFYVVNRTTVPAVLAEVGFISNKTEREKLNSSDYQNKVAGALAKGVILYLKENASLAVKTSDRKDNTPPPPKDDKIKASTESSPELGNHTVSLPEGTDPDTKSK